MSGDPRPLGTWTSRTKLVPKEAIPQVGEMWLGGRRDLPTRRQRARAQGPFRAGAGSERTVHVGFLPRRRQPHQ